MYTADYIKHSLYFKSPAGTSRGVLSKKNSWFIVLSDIADSGLKGIGECSLIPGLSYDDKDDFETKLGEVCDLLNSGENPEALSLDNFPSIQFGIETALKDFETGGERILFPSDFTRGESGILINGLIWMGSKQKMLDQISDKITQGYRVIKMKVGALNFSDELEILHTVRSKFGGERPEIRLDANGAWEPAEALDKINKLSEYNIHSIEQPIKSGRWEEMAGLCKMSPIKIALDEELIGISDFRSRRDLLETIRPSYIILKPGLHGGFNVAEEWIALAEQMKIGWWVTSALESNIGLNAIAQWTASLNSSLPQGLGTGQLFTNNIPSPLAIKGDRLWYLPAESWKLSKILL